MLFVNVGAYISGTRPKTKKALREALVRDPSTVWFDATSGLGGGQSRYRPADVADGVTLSVVGPDPFTKRSWYASVTKRADGSLKVS